MIARQPDVRLPRDPSAVRSLDRTADPCPGRGVEALPTLICLSSVAARLRVRFVSREPIRGRACSDQAAHPNQQQGVEYGSSLPAAGTGTATARGSSHGRIQAERPPSGRPDRRHLGAAPGGRRRGGRLGGQPGTVDGARARPRRREPGAPHGGSTANCPNMGGSSGSGGSSSGSSAPAATPAT